MGSDAFRSLFTLYQSKTRVSTHVEMVSNSLMVDSEDVGADNHQTQIHQVCTVNLATILMLLSSYHVPCHQPE